MGMYTGLRLRAIVKPEYRTMVNGVMDQADEARDWFDFIEEFPFMEQFSSLGRNMFIPFGGLSYMPDEWDDDNYVAAGVFRRQFNEETGFWAFNCSLKNYDSEIQVFLETVANVILESSEHIEVLYEEWERGELYEVQGNAIEYIGETEHHYRENTDDESDWWEWQQGEEG